MLDFFLYSLRPCVTTLNLVLTYIQSLSSLIITKNIKILNKINKVNAKSYSQKIKLIRGKKISAEHPDSKRGLFPKKKITIECKIVDTCF